MMEEQDKEKEVSDGDYKHTDAQLDQNMDRIQLGSSSVVEDSVKLKCLKDTIGKKPKLSRKIVAYSQPPPPPDQSIDAVPTTSNTLPDDFKSQDNIEEKHKERLRTRIEECRDCKRMGFHTTLMSELNSHEAESKKVFEQCKQKVGHVLCRTYGRLGCCFRIGKCSVVTCYHVIENCGKNYKLIAGFDYQGPKQESWSNFDMIEKFVDKNIDLAVYDLIDDGRCFPPAFTKFRDSTYRSCELLVHLLSFKKFELEIYSDTVRLNSNEFNDDRLCDLSDMMKKKYPLSETVGNGEPAFFKKYGHVLLLCKAVHGRSGGVGVFLDKKGDVVVDFMFTGGLPKFFYHTALTTDEKQGFPSCFRVETALDINTLMEKLGQ